MDRQKADTQKIGAKAEHMAKVFLQQQGLVFVTQNYHCPQGEIDLIFKDKKQWVFIEVKNRKNTHFGTPAEWVTASKQRKLILATQHYIATHNISSRDAMRFDVVGITNLNTHSIEWLIHAFEC